MIAARLLRGMALAIAVAGTIDPSVAIDRAQVPPVTVAVLDADVPDALQAAERVRASLSASFDPQVHLVARAGRNAACPPMRACVLVASRRVPVHVLGDGASLVGVVNTDPDDAKSVRITQVEGAAEQHPLAAGLLRVHLAGAAAEDDTRIDVLDGDALVGGTTMGAGATVADVRWWPIAPGARRLIVRARAADAADDAEGQSKVEAIDVGVDVRATTREVLVHETRPSWASLFVRRAIEADPRFRIRARSRLGPDLSVAIGEPARLDAATLGRASVAIIGGPEALNVSEVDLLDRFVRLRGGSLILVPDRPLSGPVVRLVPGGVRERLEREPLAAGPLRASELLVLPSGPTWHALGSTPDGASVLATRASGDGRIVISGAMDAWRFRADNEARFDNVWRSLVAEAAEAAGRPLEVTVSPRVSAPGDEVRIELAHRSMSVARTDLRASVEVTCDGAETEVVRLWPSGRGRLAGGFTAARPGACHIRASAAAPGTEEAVAAFLVTSQVRHADDGAGRRRLESLATAYAAPVVRAGEEAGLAARIAGRMPPQTTQATLNPMRSPWWIVPFVVTLAGEWWLRRRAGLR